MAKLSKTVKEIIKTVIFFIVAALLLVAFVIYPLTQTKTMFARADIETFNPDSLAEIDPTPFTQAGLPVDTLWIETDGITKVATFVIPSDSLIDPAYGTVIILPPDNLPASSQLPLINSLHQAKFNIITYDQRASGISAGNYRGFGYNEAADLEEVIAYLTLREKITSPLFVIGYETGADAALIAAAEDSRVNRVIAVDPYVTVDNCLSVQFKKHDIFWIPFQKSVFFWWYKQRSGNAPEYTENANMISPTGSTFIFYNGTNGNDELYQTLKGNISPDAQLALVTYTSDEELISELIKNVLIN